ncbi:MAG: hypothetical protein ACREA2_17635 [Blastocatellia bacterium]
MVFIIALALPNPYSAYSLKPAALPSKPGRKYTTIERLRPERLRAVSEDRSRYQNSRRPVSLETGLGVLRCVLLEHAVDSNLTGGSRSDLLGAA